MTMLGKKSNTFSVEGYNDENDHLILSKTTIKLPSTV